MIILLLALMVIVGLIFFFINKKDLCHPATLFSAAYIVSVSCACLNIDKWDVDMIPATFFILLFGYIEFILISTIIFKKFGKNDSSNKSISRREIKLPLLIVALSAIYCVAMLPLVVKAILELAGRHGTFGSFGEALTIYRDHTHHAGDDRLPQYITILVKPVIVAAYVYTYIFLNNVINRKKKLLSTIAKNLYLLFFPIIFTALYLIESSRGPILNFGLGMACVAIILWAKKNSRLFALTIKKAVAFLLICAVSLLSFYAAAPLIGRINDKKLFDYVTFYIGGSIECFNEWEKNPDSAKVVPGEYTFNATIKDLSRLKIVGDVELNNIGRGDFLYTDDGVMIGNIYTSYRNWQHDFGIPGIIIFQALHAIIITALYCSIMKKRTKLFSFKILLFGYMAYTIFMHPIDSNLFLEFPTIAIRSLILLFYIATWLVRLFSKPCPSESKEYFYIREISNASAYNASSKARADAEVIMEGRSIMPLDVYSKPGIFKIKIFKPLQLFTYFRNSLALFDGLYNAPSNAVVYVQFPISNNTFFVKSIVRHFKKKGMTFVAVVHDLDYLRYAKEAQGRTVYNRAVYYDTKVLPLFSYIISHNIKMTEVLKKNGIPNDSIINLDIFDYLADESVTSIKHTSKDKVIFAGNLDKNKSRFLYSLSSDTAKYLSLYGKNFDKGSSSANYCGSFSDINKVEELDGSFGLVWDGTSSSTCEGKFGEYLKYNNPHKASLYIAAGLPIIIWDKAAIAGFVKKNNIGYTISSLEELPDIIENIDKNDYAEKAKNIETIREKVISGYYLGSAIDKVRKKIDEKR